MRFTNLRRIHRPTRVEGVVVVPVAAPPMSRRPECYPAAVSVTAGRKGKEGPVSAAVNYTAASTGIPFSASECSKECTKRPAVPCFGLADRSVIRSLNSPGDQPCSLSSS